jgi:MOSC domain-containing protein YiiM
VLAAMDTASFETAPVESLALDMAGIPGDRHHGLTRLSGPREPWLPRGLVLRNDRQLSAVCVKEMAELAKALDLGPVAPERMAALLGANLLVAGLTAFSRIMPGSHLAIGGDWAGDNRFDGTAILRVEACNMPCRGPGRKLAAAFSTPRLEFVFAGKAALLRGLVLSVAHPGIIQGGEPVVLIPPVLAVA